MKYAAIYLLFFCGCCQITIAEDVTEQWSGHSLMIGFNRVGQPFSFEQNDIEVVLVGRMLQYQYFSGDWSGGLSVSESRGDKSAADSTAYQLDLEGESLVVFLEHRLRQFGNGTAWLCTGVGSAVDEQSLSAQRFVNQRPVGRGAIGVESRFRSFSIEGGYSFVLESSSISASVGLTQQWLHEKQRALVQPVDATDVMQQQNIDEQTLIAGLSVGYEKYWQINTELEWSVFTGVRYQYTVGGSGKIYQSQFRRGTRGVQQGQRSESFQQENDSTSAVSLRLAAYFQQFNLAFDVDKLSDQSIDDAYYGATAGLNF